MKRSKRSLCYHQCNINILGAFYNCYFNTKIILSNFFKNITKSMFKTIQPRIWGCLIALLTLQIACKNDSDGNKLTCIRIKELTDFETISWGKIGDMQAVIDTKYEKEILGKQFGEQSYATLVVTLKNTSCFSSKLKVDFTLVTFSKKEEKDTKVKEVKPNEEVEFRSTPFEIKNAEDISDKSFTVQTDYIRKKSKVTYEKPCFSDNQKCKCDPTYDDTDISTVLKVISETPLACEEDVKNVAVGQVGSSTPKNTEGGKKASKKVQSDCETSLERPTDATVATSSSDLLIRAAADSEAEVVSRAPKGAKVQVSCYSKYTTVGGKKGRFAKVKYDGKEGWAWDAFLSF